MKKTTSKPAILLCNDDGIGAPGLEALYRALRPLGDCTVVAPERESSASSHSITMKKPIRVIKHSHGDSRFGWAVSGTPVDCVKFAVSHILDREPDLIVSGINQGSNTAVNAMYSGTVGAAAEGGIMNIASFAVSITSHTYADFSTAADFARSVARKLLEKGLPDHTFLNINVPPLSRQEITGVRITRMGRMRYREIFDERCDPSHKPYYWLTGEKVLLEHADDSDEIAVSQGYIAVTPLVCDLTSHQAIEFLNTWDLSL